MLELGIIDYFKKEVYVTDTCKDRKDIFRHSNQVFIDKAEISQSEDMMPTAILL